MEKKRVKTTCTVISKRGKLNPEAFDFKSLAEKWPSSIVARSEVGKFTGGLVRPKTLANAESLGIGPHSYRFGKKCYYLADDLITWMSERQGGDR